MIHKERQNRPIADGHAWLLSTQSGLLRRAASANSEHSPLIEYQPDVAAFLPTVQSDHLGEDVYTVCFLALAGVSEAGKTHLARGRV